MTPPEGLDPDPLLLRPAREDDVRALAELHVAARRAGRMPNPRRTVDEVANDLTSALVHDHVWVADGAAGVVGYVRYVAPDHRRRSWVDDLYVAPEAAGQGVGSALLELVQAMLPDGFGLWVFAENHPARRFYAARGLLPVGETDGSQNPDGAPEVELLWPGPAGSPAPDG